MYDVALPYRERARAQSQILNSLGLSERSFALATCHRAENTDEAERLSEILSGLEQVAEALPVVLSLHPRTRIMVGDYGLSRYLSALVVTEPLLFLVMVALEQGARVIFTDSGRVQKEAFFFGVPCITMRDETEWVETVELGWNQIVRASASQLVSAADAVLRSGR